MALTAKQEAFAQAVAAGSNQSDAYRAAYDARRMKPTSVTVNASKLMADANLAQRVTSLRASLLEKAQPKMQYGLEQAMSEAAEAFAVARIKENGGAMVAAVTLRAKLNGLLIDRKEIKYGALDEMPVAELEAMDAAIEAIRLAQVAPAARARQNAE